MQLNIHPREEDGRLDFISLRMAYVTLQNNLFAIASSLRNLLYFYLSIFRARNCPLCCCRYRLTTDGYIRSRFPCVRLRLCSSNGATVSSRTRFICYRANLSCLIRCITYCLIISKARSRYFCICVPNVRLICSLSGFLQL